MVVRKLKKVYPDKQVFRFRSLSKHLEDDFTLELSKTLTCQEVERRVASHLGLDYPIEIDKYGGHMIRIRLTPHNHIADQPKYEPERRADASLSDMFGPNIKPRPESCILYYQVLDIPVRQSEASMNVPFYHAARDEVSVYNIDNQRYSVGDLLCKLKSKVQLSRPDAELRLLLIRWKTIQKVLEDEKCVGLRDKMIHVCHVDTESRTEYSYGRNFGHPFLLVIHDEETLADIKLRLHKKFRVPDDEFFKWKFAHRSEYFQDSDILYHHFQWVNWSNRARSDIPFLRLEHSDDSCKRTTYAANQQQENELLVVHSNFFPGPQLIEEVRQVEIVNPVESLPPNDSLSTRFLWTIKNFSKLDSEKHYSDAFSVSRYEWQAMIFPKGNNVNFLSVYLDTVDSTSSVYAEFSLAIVSQSDAKYTLKIDTQHEFSPGQSSWGVASFLPLSELNDPGKGYVINDTCITEANVSVVRPIKKQKLGVPFMEKSTDNFTKNNALPGNSKDIAAEVVPVFVKVEAPDAEIPNDVATIEPSEMLGITSSLQEYPLAGQQYEEPQNIHEESFEDIGGFSVLKTQSSLYKQIWLKYGHIASSHVPTSSLYSADVALVTDIMTFVMDMNNSRFSEMSPSRINTWECKLKMAEKLEFNVKWLRQRFEVIKKVFYDEYQSMQAEKARFIQVEDELKKARETVSALEIERKMYLEKENRFLFDGSL